MCSILKFTYRLQNSDSVKHRFSLLPCGLVSDSKVLIVEESLVTICIKRGELPFLYVVKNTIYMVIMVDFSHSTFYSVGKYLCKVI